FISISTHVHLLEILQNIPSVIIETSVNTLRLIAGTNEMGVWRQGLNLLLIVVLAILSVATLVKNKTYKQHYSLLLFVALMLDVPLGIYMLRGQTVHKNNTSRYLIVLAPALILLFSISDLKTLSMKLRNAVII